jgi:type IV pilus assembly protein PilO
MAVNLNAITEEFKHLNPQDPGTWPALPKLAAWLAILVAIPVAGYFLDTQSQIEELEKDQGTEKTLKDEYVKKKKEAINLDLYRQQLREIETQSASLVRQLPNRSQMDALLVDINQAGIERGLQFELFKPAPGEAQREFYAERPIQLKVVGNYHDMGQFAADVGQLPRIVTLNDVVIQASRDGTLTMDATARTFRYLDENEVAVQRKAAQASKKGPAKK